jgi:hypothetical protein
MNRDIENRVQEEAYLLEVEQDKDIALYTLNKIVSLIAQKTQEMQSKSMVDGVKEDLVHNIKQQLNSALKWLEEYHNCVDILLDAYGWQ